MKRFIIDLDVKEAYEFSILNAFLINEEELQNLEKELTSNINQKNEEKYDTNG